MGIFRLVGFVVCLVGAFWFGMQFAKREHGPTCDEPRQCLLAEPDPLPGGVPSKVVALANILIGAEIAKGDFANLADLCRTLSDTMLGRPEDCGRLESAEDVSEERSQSELPAT